MKNILVKIHNFRYYIWQIILNTIGNIKVFKYPMFLNLYYQTYEFIKYGNYYEVKDLVKPGDILLRSYKGYISSYLIGGKASHAALYIGDHDGGTEEIVHAIGKGVCKTNLYKFLVADRIFIVRPKLTKRQIESVIKKALKVIGHPYDYDFIFEATKEERLGVVDRRFSCSELIFYAFNNYVDKLGFHLRDRKYLFGLIKRKTFTPSDILEDTENSEKLSIVYEFNM